MIGDNNFFFGDTVTFGVSHHQALSVAFRKWLVPNTLCRSLLRKVE